MGLPAPPPPLGQSKEKHFECNEACFGQVTSREGASAHPTLLRLTIAGHFSGLPEKNAPSKSFRSGSNFQGPEPKFHEPHQNLILSSLLKGRQHGYSDYA
eukprot:4865641-Pyramimonas_sp.AAC.1